MARRQNPTSITLPDELHRRLKHLCVDRNIRQTQAITQALEDYLRREGEPAEETDAPALGLPANETLLIKLVEAMHSLDVLRGFMIELKHAVENVSEGTINGGTEPAGDGHRGSIAGNRRGTGEAKAG